MDAFFSGQAGSGKTTLLCKMVNECEDPLGLSFTNKAVQNVISRLTAYMTAEEAIQICHTFYSYFCTWNGRTLENLSEKSIFIEEFSTTLNF